MSLERGQSLIWLTPRSILQPLGVFDLDPCAAPSPRPWSTARRHIELPEDGLASEWHGRVWMNPPYGDGIAEWLRKMALHQNGTALIFVRSDTRHWQDWVFPYADSILFIKRRIKFHRPDGSVEGGGTAPAALISYSALDTAHLRISGIEGSLQRRG